MQGSSEQTSIAKLLRKLILKNICERLLLKISISLTNSKAGRPEVFCKKGVLRNFAKFTLNHLFRVSYLIKLLACDCGTVSGLQQKMFLYGKKVYIKNFFLLKKTFFTEKNIYENVKIYISHLRNIFLFRKCLCYK